MTRVRLNHPSLINRLANEAFFGNSLDSNLGNHYDCASENVEYKIKNDDAVVNIEFAIPGLSKSDLEIELNNEILSVKTKERDKNDPRSGFAAMQFEKRFKISDKINTDEISAHSENGVLYVTLPKVDEAIEKPARTIAIA